MGVIEELSSAIDQYPASNVKITVTDFKEPGTHINTGELCNFRVQVQNTGHLDLKDLKLHIKGTEWASVGQVPWSFSSSMFSGPKDVTAHSTMSFGPFLMKATKATPDQGTANRDLFSVHVSTFNASLHNILDDHSHHSSDPTTAYNRHIHPK